MAIDVLYQKSPNELEKEITALVVKDQRSLHHRAKVFSAIAKIQGFDLLPEIGTPDELNAAIKDGGKELQRGMSATKGIPSHFYARELILGAMYPGTLIALGNGMYFATPSAESEPGSPEFSIFPRLSRVAMQYTGGTDGSGILVRAVLKKDAKMAKCEDLKADLRDNRNRAKRAGITDVGAFAAALGFDAYSADGIYGDVPEEMVYVVLDRGKLMVQGVCLRMQK
jgi:hypothetical protein